MGWYADGMPKPTVSILSTTSSPQGVAFRVVVQAEGPPVELDLTVVQAAAGLRMNWRVTSAWAAWTAPHDGRLDLTDALTVAEEVVMPVADLIWRTLPSFQEH